MGSRRTLITIAALVVGALAVVMIYGYVGSVKDEAFGEAERIKVFVVKEGVPKGTYGEEASGAALIAEDEIPKRFWPENAIRSYDDIAGKVAVGDLAVNQVVTTDMFADPSTVQTTFSDRLEKINDEDQVAISIQVDQVRGVAGLLQPGDFVNIMITDACNVAAEEEATDAEGGEEAASTAPSGVEDPLIPRDANGNPRAEEEPGECEVDGWVAPPAGQEDPVNDNAASTRFDARYLLQKVQILAIDQTPVQLPGETSSASAEEGAEAEGPTVGTGLVTFIVPARAAQYIASAEPTQFYLTLVPRDYVPVPMTPIDPNHDALPGEDPTELTPYGPEGPGGE